MSTLLVSFTRSIPLFGHTIFIDKRDEGRMISSRRRQSRKTVTNAAMRQTAGNTARSVSLRPKTKSKMSLYGRSIAESADRGDGSAVMATSWIPSKAESSRIRVESLALEFASRQIDVTRLVENGQQMIIRSNELRCGGV